MSSGNAPTFSDPPQFGEREPGHEYTLRPSAYGVVRDAHHRVALVRTVEGVFLPGGGQEPAESLEDTVLREVREECGFTAEVISPLGVASQLVHAESEGAYFDKRSTFFSAALIDSAATTAAPGHELIWVSTVEALSLLTHESHCWAVQQDEV